MKKNGRLNRPFFLKPGSPAYTEDLLRRTAARRRRAYRGAVRGDGGRGGSRRLTGHLAILGCGSGCRRRGRVAIGTGRQRDGGRECQGDGKGFYNPAHMDFLWLELPTRS